MDIIEEHAFTQEEQIRKKGEEVAKYMYYIYEQILFFLIGIILLWITWQCIKMSFRFYRWSVSYYENWSIKKMEQRKKQRNNRFT